MNTTRFLTRLAPTLASLALLTPMTVQAQRSGAEIWRATCGNCHVLQPPGRYTAEDWRSIGTHMVITARLTSAQGEAVLEFLRTGARTTGQDPEGESALALSEARKLASGREEDGAEISPDSGIAARIDAYLLDLGDSGAEDVVAPSRTSTGRIVNSNLAGNGQP